MAATTGLTVEQANQVDAALIRLDEIDRLARAATAAERPPILALRRRVIEELVTAR